MFVGLVGAVPLFFTVESNSARVAVLAVCVGMTFTIMTFDRSLIRSRRHLFFAISAFSTIAILLVTTYLVAHRGPAVAPSPIGAAASAPAAKRSTTSVAPAVSSPAPKDLYRLKPVSGGWTMGEASVGGKEYPAALVLDRHTCEFLLHPFNGLTELVQGYNLGATPAYTKLVATVGLTDGSSFHGPITFIVRGDGKELDRDVATLGAPATVTVPIRGVKRLDLVLSGENDISDQCGSFTAAWVDARLT
jgi:hypothetical protein